MSFLLFMILGELCCKSPPFPDSQELPAAGYNTSSYADLTGISSWLLRAHMKKALKNSWHS